MSEPREPRFEDDFDVDIDPHEPAWRTYEITLEDIAIEQAHAYAKERWGGDVAYPIAKNAYQDGFLAGFAFRMGGGVDGDTL